MALNSDVKPLFVIMGVPLSIMAILAATGKFMAIVSVVSGGGLAFICALTGMATLGFYKGIELLIQGNLREGSMLTLGSGVLLGLMIGTMIGILVPGIGTLIGPLAGAGIGLLVSLASVIIAFFREYSKKPVLTESSPTEFSDDPIHTYKPQSGLQIQPIKEQRAFFEKSAFVKKEESGEEEVLEREQSAELK